MKIPQSKNLNDKNDFHLFVDQLIRVLKPKLFVPIWTTIICLGPPLNLIFNKKMEHYKLTIMLTILAITFMVYTWLRFLKEKHEFKKKELALLDIHNIIEQNDDLNKDDIELKIKSALEKIF
ncbi:hypothetical protein [Priestia megaterium]|uniref:hypothetical protein n=1 Tax=Priestia megaterium TaxID=1404 RepID=UPI0005C59C8C|nr:hypothetical protein [Priestia megaterium]